MLKNFKSSLFITLLLMIMTLNNILTEEFDDLLDMRCNDTISKDKKDKCNKCDSEIPKLLRDPISKCAKEVCNKDGKYTEPDICCYIINDQKMDDCYYNKTAEEAKAEGLTFDDASKKSESYYDKYEECLSKVFS